MNTVNAIFTKQMKDMFRNIGVLALFVVFPIIALAMENLIDVYGMEDGHFSSMMASMFIGMGLIMSTATILAEDKETHSLKFLTIAGVKPMSYMIGIGGVLFIASIITSVAFGLIGAVDASYFIRFMAIMLSGTIAGILLGGIIGLASNNVQSATGLTMPIGMALGLLPMVASFNDQIARFTQFIFTQQVSDMLADHTMDIGRPLLIIGANIAVLAIVFAIAYAKNGKAK